MTDACPGVSPALAWSRHLAACASQHPAPALSEAEAQRVQRHRDQLLAALQAQDRAALHTAKQAVLRAAYGPPADPAGPPASTALRAALRDLSWHMAILLLPRHPAATALHH